MVFSYYPGCTLKTKAKELDVYAKKSAYALGITLEEIEEWQCCGGVYPLAEDEIATRLSSVRALKAAKEKEQELVTVCSACHHVLKRVNNDMKQKKVIAERVNNYIKPEEPYFGDTEVIHYLEMIRDKVTFNELKSKVSNPLKDMKIAAYYGCLLLRPSKEMQFDNPENPTILEDFIKAIGATPIKHSYRNECCGGYVTLSNDGLAKSKSKKIVESAKLSGAEAIITACPLCMYNLTKDTDTDIPVYYFTELLAEALGVK